MLPVVSGHLVSYLGEKISLFLKLAAKIYSRWNQAFKWEECIVVGRRTRRKQKENIYLPLS
jgi:hypothetical protein